MSKTIIDLDIGCDDALALLLALASPHIDLLALTTVFGNTERHFVDANLVKLFYNLEQHIAESSNPSEEKARWFGLKEQQKIRVGHGAEEPLGEAEEKETAGYFHGPDGLSNIKETHKHLTPPTDYSSPYLQHDSFSGSDLILDVLKKEEKGSVTLIALGPLTNVALAVQRDPETFARVKRVIWMGAALDVPGNTSPVAEFNLYADPLAGHVVFTSSLPPSPHPFPVTICPLDITTPHAIHFTTLLSKCSSRLQEFTNAFLEGTHRVYQNLSGNNGKDKDELVMEHHDPMVVWYACALAEAESKGEELEKGAGQGEWETRKRLFRVEKRGELTRGMCVVDRRGKGEATGELRTKGGIQSAPIGEQETKEEKDQGINVLTRTPIERYEADFMKAVFGK